MKRYAWAEITATGDVLFVGGYNAARSYARAKGVSLCYTYSAANRKAILADKTPKQLLRLPA